MVPPHRQEIFNNPHTDFKETYYGVDACGDILVEAITDYICKRADEGGCVHRSYDLLC